MFQLIAKAEVKNSTVIYCLTHSSIISDINAAL